MQGNRTRRNARQDSNQGEDPSAGRQRLTQWGEQLGGVTLGAVSPGDGEKGQTRRMGASRSDLSHFRAAAQQI
jgi:hypothetical protein